MGFWTYIKKVQPYRVYIPLSMIIYALIGRFFVFYSEQAIAGGQLSAPCFGVGDAHAHRRVVVKTQDEIL